MKREPLDSNMSPKEQVEAFEEEATAAKRSHGEPEEFVEDTEVDGGAGRPADEGRTGA